MLVTICRGTTNQGGETNDIRFVKDAVALRGPAAAGRGASGAPENRGMPLSPKLVGLRNQRGDLRRRRRAR